MKTVYKNECLTAPRVSFVLLDWSCRESFHVFPYLNAQTAPRDQYEIIWIEYFNRVPPEMESGLQASLQAGKPPMLDQWIVLEVPADVYYHKHLMYNVGILASRGEIVVLCDSDVMLRPTFVESIIEAFVPPAPEDGPGIVLHLDEVRSINRKFYPFNNPSVEELLEGGCFNWLNGKTKGLWDEQDPLHTRNYGACMAARREDLIRIGGADEHIDYLGHICGPYEMTFRLMNAGHKEIWHQSEFLYHTWHPGTDGANNYMGPHDGRNLSSTALKALYQNRIFPLTENEGIRTLRQERKGESLQALMSQAVTETKLRNWSVDRLNREERPQTMAVASFTVLWRRFLQQVGRFLKKRRTPMELLRAIFITPFRFLRQVLWENKYFVYFFSKCETCLDELAAKGVRRVALFGTGELSNILYFATRNKPVEIEVVYGEIAGERFHNLTTRLYEDAKGYSGTFMVCSQEETGDRIARLKAMGVETSRIVIVV
jgi:hypothetical protein